MNNLIERLTKTFSNFPNIGKRTASRFIFYLIKLPREQSTQLIADLTELFKIDSCPICFFPIFKNTEKLCEFCSDNSRNKNLICVVEKENDLLAIENTRRYRGVYHILGGTILSFSQDTERGGLRIKELLERIKSSRFPDVGHLKEKHLGENGIEIILALRPDTAGDATNLYLDKYLKPLDVKITRLARGLPTGADLEYADETTLSEALNSRK
ncbi:recombination protein RecR [Candidatus Azambacteria bacterium]|nr:recombination protein RecR [Candidatus Azambacteria bacterium]